MGLMDRFKKSECEVCGKEVGAMGKRKIDEGYICKECAGKLSPFFTERKKTTIDDIRAQIEYREANVEDVAAFTVNKTLGLREKVLIDETKGNFVVTGAGKNWRDENPDVIPLSQVTGAQIDYDEDRTEETYTDKEGNEKSYVPPRYTYTYYSKVILNLNSPWFDEITVDIDRGTSSVPNSSEAMQGRQIAQEVCEALTAERERIHVATEAARAPKTAVTCPHCSATTVPDENGCCEYCGGVCS